MGCAEASGRDCTVWRFTSWGVSGFQKGQLISPQHEAKHHGMPGTWQVFNTTLCNTTFAHFVKYDFNKKHDGVTAMVSKSSTWSTGHSDSMLGIHVAHGVAWCRQCAGREAGEDGERAVSSFTTGTRIFFSKSPKWLLKNAN